MSTDTDIPPSDSPPFTVERRAELLARAPAAAVVALADRCVAGDEITIVAGPEVGMVMMTVREPIARERFHLGEVLVTRAEVELGGHRGWSMRMGDDRLATLAAAVLDAEVAAARPGAADVVELCRLTAAAERDELDAEWDELAPTQVNFDEID
jgi:alpha-D-ribose 1-methylphosphonate 5-triphosphate synthase subunit PhnG